MANFAEINPYLARLRQTPRRIAHYTQTRDGLSLERARALASARRENLCKATIEGTYRLRARARYLSLRRKMLEAHGLELNTTLLMQLRDYFFDSHDPGQMPIVRTAEVFTMKAKGHEHKLGRAGEGLLKACVWAYEVWKEREVDCRRWSGCYRALAKGNIERGRFAKLRWKRLRTKWGAVGAWKKVGRSAKIKGI